MKNKPTKPKESTSMRKAAKAYKKTHKQDDKGWTGARMFDENAKSYGLGGSEATNTYKPKAKKVTVGGTRKGKGATVKKIGRAKTR